jgi:hypothetical protein
MTPQWLRCARSERFLDAFPRSAKPPSHVTCLILCVGLLIPSAALAQRPRPRFEIGGGGAWVLESTLGTADAELRANRNGTTVPVTLFSTDNRIQSAPGVEARGSYALGRRFAIEGALAYGRPELQTDVRGDIENVPAVTIRERIDQYAFIGRLIVSNLRGDAGGRTTPFLAAGAGYLRQLHEGRTLIEHGQVFTVGGGIKHRLGGSSSGSRRGAGIRADVEAWLLRDGITFEKDLRVVPVFGASLFYAF